MKYLRFFAITLFIILLASCQNIFGGGDSSSSSDQNKHYVSFSGTISLEGAYPSELLSKSVNAAAGSDSRTAFPSIPAGAIYRVTASKNNTVIYDSANGNDDITFAADNSYFTICRLETGVEWTITVGLYEDTSSTSPLMSDSFPKTFSMEDNVLTHEFVLRPTLTGGKGKIELTFSFPTNTFNGFSYTCLNTSNDYFPCLVDPHYNDYGYLMICTGTDPDAEQINTGSYTIQFDFKKDDFVLYSDIQTINIFKNMKTNTWVNNGGSSAIKSDGTYVITQDMIDDYAQTQIFVGTNSWATANNDGNGSRFAPFASMEKALNYIKSIGKSTTDFTIWVSGEVQGTSNINDHFNGKFKSLTICGLNGVDENDEPLDSLTGYAEKLNTVSHVNGDVQDYNGLTVEGDGSIFATGEFAPVLYIHSEADYEFNVQLKNIGIKKGAAGKGAGIHLSGSHVTLTINDGTLISDNHSSLFAGGIYVDYIATCIMNGGKITENSTYHSGSASSGGGIQIANGGSFIMNAGEISNNRAMNFGGGVSLKTNNYMSLNQSKFIMNGGKITGNYANGVTPAPNNTKSGYGGAVYIHDGTFTMTAGEISGNYTNCEAGAVYIAGELDTSAAFDMQGGIIKENTLNDAPDTSKCSGIYLRSKAFKIKGNSFIPKSNDKHIIYLASGKTIDINGTLAPTSDGTASGTAENVAAVINLDAIYEADLTVLTGNSSNVNSASGKMRMTNRTWLISQGKLIYGVIATAAELKDILTGLNTNNINTPYNIMIYDAVPDFDVLKEAIHTGDKYVNLSFPNATFTTMSSLGTYTHNNTSYSLKIVSITIPASVTSCVINCSSGYSALKNIEVEDNNTTYKSIDGVLYSFDGKDLICLPCQKELEDEDGDGHKTYTIPSSVETIKYGALARNSNLNFLNIPATVKTLENNAVYWCNSLTSVTFEEGLKSIGGNAFTDTKVTSFTIPESVTNIEIQPFALNAYSTLQNITVSSSNTTYYSYDGALYKPENNKLTIIHCPPKKTVLKIKDNITHKGGNAFWYGAHNSTLTTIVFEEGVTEIKIDFTDSALSQVTDIYLPSTITQISSSLFNSAKIKNVYYAETEDNRNSNTQLKNFLNVLGITWHYSTSYTGD